MLFSASSSEAINRVRQLVLTNGGTIVKSYYKEENAVGVAIR